MIGAGVLSMFGECCCVDIAWSLSKLRVTLGRSVAAELLLVYGVKSGTIALSFKGHATFLTFGMANILFLDSDVYLTSPVPF
jgi:putative copper export protein